MKKTVLILVFGFCAFSAKASDIVIPLFGESTSQKTTPSEQGKDFPLFLPPTAPLETVKDLPFNQPINTPNTVNLSTPVVPVEKEESQKTSPSYPIIQPKTVVIEPPEEKKIQETKQPAKAQKEIRFTQPSSEKQKTVQKEVPVQPQKKPEIARPKEVSTAAPVDTAKTIVIKETPARKPSLLQKSMELPVDEQKEILNPFEVNDAVLLGDELPADVFPEVQEVSKAQVDKMDIMGIYLYMTPQEVIDEAQERGFRVSFISHAIPTFATARLEKECRTEEKLVQLERIQDCVRLRAQKEGIYYVSELILENPETKEQVKGRFTSLFTENKAYYIEYTALGDNSLGTSIKDIAKKTARRDLFWDLVFEKYGEPTYKEQLVWGDPREAYFKAYMEGSALNGKLILEDKKLPADDVSEAYANLPPPPEVNFFSFVK